jgi:hypothetical protein
MSTRLGSVKGRPGAKVEQQGVGLRHEVHVTRFAGGLDGVCVQLTIHDQYVQLDIRGVASLVEVLSSLLREQEVRS